MPAIVQQGARGRKLDYGYRGTRPAQLRQPLRMRHTRHHQVQLFLAR